MFRQIALRQTKTISSSMRPFSQTPANSGVIDAAKEALKTANKKIGEVAADGIEKAEQVTPNKDTVINAADKVNKKTGEVLSEGIDKAQKVTPNQDDLSQAAENVGDKVADAADKANKKTGKVLADGIDKAEKAVPNAANNAKSKVAKNHEGYKDLQDKGSKTETEQNRPDDAV
ncbi:uncharacterized protein CANTADRAFT_6743 [Suhomyces tanzawaensis NRRL Y-17324]|uniref:Uncharacterized protein n=1 Tax=Suhomyces tanzawaensis NRRL Y-17324 TaxID=984487 RepID=A0A1E4SFQ2_9ASCO|nr:uncharacterized protein CANTADRAFT_6743 [Suhomyces tanzawaensis NRRL Y-17324]ODV78349.1 hypothetical protein CANTADRAFT_6743 [Suhomyces tanzawaensis NRRL Y-17324]